MFSSNREDSKRKHEDSFSALDSRKKSNASGRSRFDDDDDDDDDIANVKDDEQTSKSSGTVLATHVCVALSALENVAHSRFSVFTAKPSSSAAAAADEEIDPLDAFMASVETDLKTESTSKPKPKAARADIDGTTKKQKIDHFVVKFSP